MSDSGIPARERELTVAGRFNGPPASANGGYVAGLLAEPEMEETVEVTLRLPPPLDTPMRVVVGEGGVRSLVRGAETVAEAVRVTTPLEPAGGVVPVVAREARGRFRGALAHPFPTCFACGTERAPGDGLRVHAGPVSDAPDERVVACDWTPDASLAPGGAGPVPMEMVWAALDCPGGWSSDITGRPMVLGRMTAWVRRRPIIGRPYVVTGRLLGEEGRKVLTASAIHDEEGREVARANAIWIRLREETVV
ncbi:hypothetical protein ACQEU5_24165 [Marinactinospora thermotolerans]|uniref:Thioesterase-like superfamily protein n=1 Tax=Marinactinospora thermotolerans DSM 45154 TaxID=1122192 RepID=A0A1T4KCB7_9ACTN|nr:hypothetical protein [Marinactinospora thermotolerans]SJZ39973.1 hypothetical protein SAMN02745673_00299 [Marinactinospora thermotolerans DSM 45154]